MQLESRLNAPATREQVSQEAKRAFHAEYNEIIERLEKTTPMVKKALYDLRDQTAPLAEDFIRAKTLKRQVDDLPMLDVGLGFVAGLHVALNERIKTIELSERLTK